MSYGARQLLENPGNLPAVGMTKIAAGAAGESWGKTFSDGASLTCCAPWIKPTESGQAVELLFPR